MVPYISANTTGPLLFIGDIDYIIIIIPTTIDE
jgi:hypothetical protein